MFVAPGRPPGRRFSHNRAPFLRQPPLRLIFPRLAAAQIPLGKPRRAATIRVAAPEGAFAAVLGETQARRPQVEIGSCPRDDDGVYCNIVFAGDDQECIKRAAGDFSAWLRENQVGHSGGG